MPGFVVNGTGVPGVPFDIGESYAGTLPILTNSSDPETDPNQLYFWFFPSDNVNATDEITIWLNGGPGCSSLDGLLQENSPISWQSGTYEPQPNPYSFTNLTNMVWVDQPIGTGFSPAAPGAAAQINNEVDIGRDFAGFWQNFMTTFNLTGRKVYITGESYAGQYIPYIAQYMLEQNNTDYYNVAGIQINDPSIGPDSVLIEAPSVGALNVYNNVFSLNESFVADVNARAESCGYTSFMEQALTFPPAGKFVEPNENADGCDLWDDIVTAAILVNPCFNVYHLTDFCPFLWDELGFPSLAIGPNNYFNQSDVQMAINAPPTDYVVCGDDSLFPKGDQSEPSSFTALPYVVERTNNVIVGSGLLDYLLLTNGTLAALNNMTWNGMQGFSANPMAEQNLFVPYNPFIAEVIDETETQPIPATPVGLQAGGGILGTTYTERGLTFTTVNLAGHEIPQYVSGASFRHLEKLLGRISSLTEVSDFTTETGDYQGNITSPAARRFRA